jgi:phage protein D
MLNTIASPEARTPRMIVKVNGTTIQGAIDFEVNNNNFYGADTFNVTFAVSLLPPDRGVDWWAAQVEIYVEIFAGFPSDPQNFTTSDLDSLIYGQVDDIHYDPVSRVISVTGRDLTATMIDTKTTIKYQNLKASDIAQQIASAHGLTPVVTATSKKVGTYYQIDSVRLTDQASEWDLLTFLANQEKFAVYVKGKELHFEPYNPETSNPYLIEWNEPDDITPYARANVTRLDLSRELTVAKGVVVWVQSVNPKTGKTYSVSYPANKAKGTKPGQSAPHLQVYTFRKAAMLPDAALAFAQKKHKELTQHEMKLRACFPADSIVSVFTVLKLTGTGTAFDQTYYPDNIVRRMSIDEGYTMDVSAKNIAHNNEVTL